MSCARGECAAPSSALESGQLHLSTRIPHDNGHEPRSSIRLGKTRPDARLVDDSVALITLLLRLDQVPWALLAGAPFTRRSWRELLYALVAFPLGRFRLRVRGGVAVLRYHLSVVVIGLVSFACPRWECASLGRSIEALSEDFSTRTFPHRTVSSRARRRRLGPPRHRRPGGLACPGLISSSSSPRPRQLGRGNALRIASLWFVLAPAQWAANVGTENSERRTVLATT